MSINQCNTYTPSFFITPSRITNLPGMTLTFLKFYETIFQFWNKGLGCYLTNTAIKERTGISSSSTISEAFAFFERHNEMQRVTKDGIRFIIQPQLSLRMPDTDENDDDDPGEIPENSQKSHPSENRDPLSQNRIPPSRSADKMPLAAPIHNIKNINIKNNNKKINKKDFEYSLEDAHFTKEGNAIPQKQEMGDSKKTDSASLKSFDEFWEIYPVKKGQLVCKKIWQKQKLEKVASNIIHKLMAQASHDTQWQQGYIPNPAKYLREERWKDEITLKKPMVISSPRFNHESTDWANRFSGATL